MASQQGTPWAEFASEYYGTELVGAGYGPNYTTYETNDAVSNQTFKNRGGRDGAPYVDGNQEAVDLYNWTSSDAGPQATQEINDSAATGADNIAEAAAQGIQAVALATDNETYMESVVPALDAYAANVIQDQTTYQAAIAANSWTILSKPPGIP